MRSKPLSFFVLLIVIGCSTGHQKNDWESSTENYDKSLITALRDKIDRNEFKSITSIIVIKKEKLLIEEYFNNSTKNDVHDVRSVGKTFASAILGISIAEGFIKDENERLGSFYKIKEYENFSQAKSDITLKNLLTMSSGFDGDDNVSNSVGNEDNMYGKSNWIEWILNLPLASDRNPGDSCIYFTAGIVLIGDIIDKSVPNGLEHYAKDKLFSPLGISEIKWKYTPQGVPSTAGGIQLSSRDLAKFGQLYLSNGMWHNCRIIPEQWVDKSLRRYYKISNTDGYGFLWWNKDYSVMGKSFNTFYCSGNGGNKIFIFPELNSVVVITAEAFNQSYAHAQVDEIMTHYVLPSILD